jgi:hypothetical protein
MASDQFMDIDNPIIFLKEKLEQRKEHLEKLTQSNKSKKSTISHLEALAKEEKSKATEFGLRLKSETKEKIEKMSIDLKKKLDEYKLVEKRCVFNLLIN